MLPFTATLFPPSIVLYGIIDKIDYLIFEMNRILFTQIEADGILLLENEKELNEKEIYFEFRRILR